MPAGTSGNAKWPASSVVAVTLVAAVVDPYRLGLAGNPPLAEVILVERDIRLAEMTGGRLHLAKISTAEAVEAIAAAKERRVGIVSYLVEHNMADPREIAIAASHEFGAPLLDLDAIQPDLDTVRIVSEKILRKHRVLPLVKRGKKLKIALTVTVKDAAGRTLADALAGKAGGRDFKAVDEVATLIKKAGGA
mgnify:CR=1 FL=1